MCQTGYNYRYFPEASKNILLVHTHAAESAKNFCSKNNLPFVVKHSYRYLGGFIREKAIKNEWITTKIDVSKEAIVTLSEMATFVLQCSRSIIGFVK